MFNYKVVKNVIFYMHDKFQRIRSLFDILFNFMEFMESKEENGYDMIIILFMTLNMV